MHTYARVAGVLLLISFVAGGYGEFYIPSTLISEATATTAMNAHASAGAFRLGFAAYLIEALCDIGLTYVFYVLLRPVDRNLAILAVLFRLMGTATFAIAEFFNYGGILLAQDGYLIEFSATQRDSVLQFIMQWFSSGGEIFTIFYGAGLLVVGYLFYRSGYIPKLIGALVALGGLGFVIHNFTFVLAPTLALAWLLLPAMAGMLILATWLLVRGVRASD